MATHEQIVSAYESYLVENESFETKNVKAAAARARKALGELGKLAKARRAEIQEKKNNLQKDMHKTPIFQEGRGNFFLITPQAIQRKVRERYEILIHKLTETTCPLVGQESWW